MPSSVNDRTMDKLWDLREEGIKLRDEGLHGDVNPDYWLERIRIWEDKMVAAALELDYPLGRRIRPVSWQVMVRSSNPDVEADTRHMRHVRAVSAILKCVELRLIGF